MRMMCKLDNPYSITFLIRISIFEWYKMWFDVAPRTFTKYIFV